jgi:type IV pilus assembly protein PilM
MAVVIKPSGPVLGLDIGSKEIKAVEARAGRDGIQLTGLAVVPTPEDLYISGTVIDPKALGQFIKKLLAERKIHAKKVVSAISGQPAVVVRFVEMSKMSDKELKDTMKWEVERHVPYSANDVEMDFVPVPSPTAPADAQTMEVLLVVAQKEALNIHLDVLQSAGLQPSAVDVAPLAASRALIDTGDPAFQSETVAVVSIGTTTTDINIFRNGTLAFTRPVPLGGDTFTSAIANTLVKSGEEAEALKLEHATVLLDQLAGVGRSLELDPEPVETPGQPFTPEPVFTPEPSAEPTQMNGTPGGYVDLSMPLGLLGGIGESIPAAEHEDDSAPKRESYDLSADLNDSSTQAFNLQAPFNYTVPEATSGDSETTPESVFDLEAISPASNNRGNVPNIIAPPDEVVEEPASLTPVHLDGLGLSEQIFHAIQPVLTDFVTELRRSLDYYMSRSTGETISKVILCGGGAKLPNLDTYLANELNIVVDFPSLGPKVMCTYKNYTAEDLQKALPVLPVSLGLAIRDMVDEAASPKPKPKKAKKEKAA